MLPADFDATHFRHVDVQQHQIRWKLRSFSSPSIPFLRHPLRTLQWLGFTHDSSNLGFVIDHEYASGTQ